MHCVSGFGFSSTWTACWSPWGLAREREVQTGKIGLCKPGNLVSGLASVLLMDGLSVPAVAPSLPGEHKASRLVYEILLLRESVATDFEARLRTHHTAHANSAPGRSAILPQAENGRGYR